MMMMMMTGEGIIMKLLCPPQWFGVVLARLDNMMFSMYMRAVSLTAPNVQGFATADWLDRAMLLYAVDVRLVCGL